MAEGSRGHLLPESITSINSKREDLHKRDKGAQPFFASKLRQAAWTTTAPDA